ncbi:unnamed protein product [Tenebrio molitor]|nr:unnamed protein product [Tenebrio molitor]
MVLMISYREVFTTKRIQWVEETERAQEYLEASCRRFGKFKTSAFSKQTKKFLCCLLHN